MIIYDTTNQSLLNQSLLNQSLLNQSLLNQSLLNQSLINQSLITNQPINYFLIFLGGGIGSVCRFGLSQCLSQWSAAFPVATLCANVLACAVLSFAVVHFTKGNISDEMRLFVAIGFCGGLSTFSTFSNETLQLLQTQRYGLAALYITCSVVVCLAGMVAVAKV